MALNKLKFNSLNVTPTAGKTVGFNSSANGLEATFSGGSMAFISKQTASSSSTISFTSGIDSTYKEYLFLLLIYILVLMSQNLLFKLIQALILIIINQ